MNVQTYFEFLLNALSNFTQYYEQSYSIIFELAK